jgi:hypothetical protein
MFNRHSFGSVMVLCSIFLPRIFGTGAQVAGPAASPAAVASCEILPALQRATHTSLPTHALVAIDAHAYAGLAFADMHLNPWPWVNNQGGGVFARVSSALGSVAHGLVSAVKAGGLGLFGRGPPGYTLGRESG